MSRVVFQGETFVSVGGAPQRFRFEVRVLGENQLVIWLEDCATKTQWRTLPMGFDKDSQAQCQNDEAERVAEHLADCLRVSSSSPLKMVAHDGRVSATLYLGDDFTLGNVDAVATYGVQLRAWTLDRIDNLEARIRDLEESVRPPHTAATKEDQKRLTSEKPLEPSRAGALSYQTANARALESKTARVVVASIVMTIVCVLLIFMGEPGTRAAQPRQQRRPEKKVVMPGELYLQHTYHGTHVTLKGLDVNRCFTFDQIFPRGITRAMWNSIGDSSTDVLFFPDRECNGKHLLMATGSSGDYRSAVLASSLSFAVSNRGSDKYYWKEVVVWKADGN